MKPSIHINEDNKNELPQYRLILCDKYSNPLDTFTWDPTKLVVTLNEDPDNVANKRNTFGSKTYVTFAATGA